VWLLPWLDMWQNWRATFNQLIERIIIMQFYTNIEIDNDEIWESVSYNVNELITEQVPEHLTELEERTDYLDEKYGELNYRVDELEDHETEDHEIRLTELSEKVEELTEQVERIKQLIPRDIIETIVRDLLAQARLTI
jgi:predicted nuclease with TOPRIM domain